MRSPSRPVNYKSIPHVIVVFILISLGVHKTAGAQSSAPVSSQQQADRCRKILQESIIDFYLPACVDKQDGGYLEILDAKGKFATSDEKFLTLQVRQMWFFSTLMIAGIEKEQSLTAADSGYTFLQQYFLDKDNGGYFTKVSAKGVPTDRRKHIYPSSFVIYGLVEYHRATGKQEPLQEALAMFRLLEDKCHDPENGGYNEFFEDDWELISGDGHSGYIGDLGTKTYNSHLHLLEAFAQLYRATSDELVGTRLKELIDICTKKVRHPSAPCNLDGWTPDWKLIDTPKNVRASYGHDVECAWLVLDAADAVKARTPELEAWAIEICEHAISFGHDQKHGGFFYSGPVGSESDDRKKEWWTQSEALVALLTMKQLTGDAKYQVLFNQTLDFVEKFHVAKEGGWWANLNEDGSLKDYRPRTSMWQGGYHNGRAMLMCEQLLRGE